MKSILASVIALVLAASTAFAQLTINTPSDVTECEPLLISWTGGQAPFYLTIYSPNFPNLVTFPAVYGQQITWLVNVIQNATQIAYSLRDATGTQALSAPFDITAGLAGVTCDTSTTSFSASTIPPTGSATATGSSPATATSSKSGSSASGTAKTGAGSSTASPTSTKSAGASRITGQIAAAGIIGAAMVALLG